MYNFFKNIAEKTSCSMSGVCSIHPSISAMDEVLSSIIREISFYIVKMKELGYTNKILMSQLSEALSVFIINTNINQSQYLELIKKLDFEKKKIKAKYLSYCSDNELPSEVINTKIDINSATTISQLIEYAQVNSITRQKLQDKNRCKRELEAGEEQLPTKLFLR